MIYELVRNGAVLDTVPAPNKNQAFCKFHVRGYEPSLDEIFETDSEAVGSGSDFAETAKNRLQLAILSHLAEDENGTRIWLTELVEQFGYKLLDKPTIIQQLPARKRGSITS